MLPTTMRAARVLRVRPPTLATTSRAPTSSFSPQTRIPSNIRRSAGSIAPCHRLQTVVRVQMSTKPPLPNKIDREFEKEVAQKKLEPRPDEVSSASTVRSIFETSQAPAPEDPDLMAGLKGDLNTIKETFALTSVPRQPFALGLAGTLPYLATSLSTAVLSWNLNTEWPTQSSFLNAFLFNHEQAAHWLHILEPIQVGYGAVIVSFLGAIHWGLEFAEKQTLEDRARLRYGIGVLAPAVAWPTIFMPIQWALTTQFAAFCALYFTDSRATAKGWAPAWYASYRFVLTAVVGTAIVISLIGRAKVGEGKTRLSKTELADRIKGKPTPGQNRNWAKEEEEEKERIQEQKKQEEKKKQEEERNAKEEEKKKDKQPKKDAGAGTKKKDQDQKADRKKEEGGAAFDSGESSGAKEGERPDGKQEDQQ